jgi:ketosteroid isomerase-like protein
MSEENVEFVRKALEAFNAFMRGETSREAILELGDPQFEFNWHGDRTMPDSPQRLQGPHELLRFWEDLRSAWDDLSLEPVELIEAPGNRVLTLSRQTGRGRESGVPVEVHAFTVWTIRNKKAQKIELFRHRADALEAAGLPE